MLFNMLQIVWPLLMDTIFYFFTLFLVCSLQIMLFNMLQIVWSLLMDTIKKKYIFTLLFFTITFLQH